MRTLARLAAAALLLCGPLATPVAARPSGGTEKPQICPAAYATKTFETRQFTSANVDTGKTAGAGFQWYFWNWLSGFQAGDTATLNADGSISASGVSGPNGTITSAAATGTAPYFHGTVFGGGFCVEAQISFDGPSVDTSLGWPSFWSMAFEHLSQQGASQWSGQATGYEHFIEADILEFYKLVRPEYLGSMIDWYGQYKSTCAPDGYCRVAHSVSNTPGAIQHNTDWHGWHRVGAVWTPATSSTNGSMQYYFDDEPLGPPFTWSQFTTQSPPPTDSTPWTFGIIDQQHLVLLFGSNTTPINVRSVVVYQASTAGNLTN